MPEEGFEPPHPCEREILSLLCLPFHHSGLAPHYISGVAMVLQVSRLSRANLSDVRLSLVARPCGFDSLLWHQIFFSFAMGSVAEWLDAVDLDKI